MHETISVRLVPKRKEIKINPPVNLFRHYVIPGAAPAPGGGPADEALRMVRSMQINAEKTPGNAIHAEITTEQAQTLLGVRLTEKEEHQSEAPYLFTQKALHVPDVLASTVDFAYIPTPPRYFFPATATPPLPNAHYLTLDDVLKKLNGHLCHRNGWQGDGVKVAIVDTGFGDHPFFDAHPFNIKRIAPKKVQDPCDDSDGHGTGVCANLLTLAPKCRFIGVKKGRVTADALELAVAQNPDVISISWGWDVDDKKLGDLQLADTNMYNELMDIARIIDDAVSDGVIVVCAAGNGHKAFPACLENVIAVGGVTVRTDSSLGASNCASSFVSTMYPGRNVPDLCGLMGETNPESGHILLPVPADSRLDGHNLHPAHKGQGWGVFSGTSAAAPQVAGIVALILSTGQHLNVHQVKRILARSCTDITSGVTFHKEAAVQGPDLATGSGLVNAFKACASVTGA